MNLTPQVKAYIDGLSVTHLIRNWRCSKFGDAWFQGESGDYWTDRMRKLMKEDPQTYKKASDEVGW